MKKYILLLVMMSFWACQTKPANNNKPKQQTEITFKKQAVLTVSDSLNHPKAQFDIEIAQDDYHRETGLMYRRTMKDNQAMLFIFDDNKPRYFWMKNTYIPLDIIYIGTDKTIVSMVKNAKVLDQTALPSNVPAKYVLEIKAGLADRYRLQKGDRVSW